MLRVTRKNDGTIAVTCPYHAESNRRLKALSGRWRDDHWELPGELEDEAREVLIEVFGADDIDKIELQTVKIRACKRIAVHNGPVEAFGKTIARAFGRDSGAKLGDDVALLSPDVGIGSGGSHKNWTTVVDEGATFKLLKVFPKHIDEFNTLDDPPWEILSIAPANRQPKAAVDTQETFNAVIDFAIETDDPKAFLTAWREGDWEAIAACWPDFDQKYCPGA